MANIEQITKINDVFLTPDALESLTALQDEDNGLLNDMLDAVADISSYFGSRINTKPAPGPQDLEINIYIEQLSFLRGYIKRLKKPSNL
jgi:hypothetical protein